jgi:peroxiredoxin
MLKKYFLIVACCVMSLTLLAEENDNRGYVVKVGDIAPDFCIKTSNDSSILLSSLRGKVVMLQFTASWCKVCRREMPYIEKEIWRKHFQNSHFALFGIDYQETKQAVADFITATGVSYPIAYDTDGAIFIKYAESNAGITRNVIIGTDGRIVFLTRLFSQSEFEEMCRIIDNLLADISN